MIIRSRQKNRSLFQRLFGSRKTATPDSVAVLTTAELELELAKEAARSSRRKTDREFVLISIYSSSDTSLFEHENAPELVCQIRKQLRISDVIASSATTLYILLPETNQDGGAIVANKLVVIGRELNISLDSEFKVYPDDDGVATGANELRVDGAHGNGQQPATRELESARDFSDKQGEDSAMSMLASRPDLNVPFSQPMSTPIWKRTVDIVGSLTGLVLLSPVFIISAIAIKHDSSGPVFFKQRREGKDGEHFSMWKFRTMCVDAESQKEELRGLSEQNGPAFKLKQDPRVTRSGRYLRKTCIDELPQLINVLKGEMSLVGPRPLPINESEDCTVWQRSRLRALPGLTCIWQVDGGRNIEFDEWMRMDLEYLQRRSFWFDLKLIFRTAIVAVMHRGSV